MSLFQYFRKVVSHSNNVFCDTDVERGFSVEGPELVVESDNVTLNCAASKYTYSKDLEWLYKDSDKFLPITGNKPFLYI